MSALKVQPSAHNRRKKARLAQLLAHRAELGTRWAEQMSHAQSGVGDLMSELTVVETAITDQWPHMVQTWLPQWVVADAKRVHDPDLGPATGCSICALEFSQRAA